MCHFALLDAAALFDAASVQGARQCAEVGAWLQVPGNSYAGGAAVPAPQSALQQPLTAAGLAGCAATVPFWRRLFGRPSSAASVTTGAQLGTRSRIAGSQHEPSRRFPLLQPHDSVRMPQQPARCW